METTTPTRCPLNGLHSLAVICCPCGYKRSAADSTKVTRSSNAMARDEAVALLKSALHGETFGPEEVVKFRSAVRSAIACLEIIS